MKKYGSDWEDEGLKIDSLGLILAPEIFRTQEAIFLPIGISVPKGVEYFNWLTARGMAERGCFPDGWRLPSAEETTAICHWHQQASDNKKIFGFDGFICPENIPKYYRDPASESSFVASKRAVGYYWTGSMKTLNYPYAVFSCEMPVTGNVSIYGEYGLPIILVKDI